MKSPESRGSMPLKVKTPQEEHKANTNIISKEAAKAEEELKLAEKAIFDYQEAIERSYAAVDVLREKRSKFDEDDDEFGDITKHMDIKTQHIKKLGEKKEAKITKLMGLRDDKETLEKGAEYSKINERRKLH